MLDWLFQPNINKYEYLWRFTTQETKFFRVLATDLKSVMADWQRKGKRRIFKLTLREKNFIFRLESWVRLCAFNMQTETHTGPRARRVYACKTATEIEIPWTFSFLNIRSTLF